MEYIVKLSKKINIDAENAYEAIEYAVGKAKEIKTWAIEVKPADTEEEA